MYKQVATEKDVKNQHGTLIEPVATLADEWGGRAQISTDDHCYVLHIGSKNRPYRISSHWFREVVEVLKTLPLPD